MQNIQLYKRIAIAAAIISGIVFFFGYALGAPLFTDFPLFQEDTTDTQFPVSDKQNVDPQKEENVPSIDLQDPPNLRDSISYDPDSNVFYLDRLLGDLKTRPGSYMTASEYQKYRFQQDEQNYFKQRIEALNLLNQKPTLPTLYKEGLFDRIFGGNTISIKPQGSVEITANTFYEHRQNPSLPESAQRVLTPDFLLNMNVNLIAQIGDKLKLNISQNTQPTNLTQNLQKVEYTGKEDEILKKIELGNVSFPLRSNLISGVQSLFGIKTQLQFGKLWITSAISQQRSQRKSLTIQGGGQTQDIEIKADNYDENKNFLLGQYFYDNYNKALENFPIINSQVQLSKVEVYITNRNGATTGIRDVLAFMDLGEKKPFNTSVANTAGSTLPDNRSNLLYDQLQQLTDARSQATATQAVLSLGLQEGQDFQRTTMRQLQPSEFSYQAQLGYITLNAPVYPDDVISVAYRYTYNGQIFQVGEFADEIAPDTSNQKVMFMKLMKGTSNRPTLPIWNLMMKNIYTLNALNISKEGFMLNIFYQDPGGGEKRYLPEGPKEGVPLITLLNLDRLNAQNDPQPDGVFDYVEGITVNSQQGKLIFPILEPFGKDLKPSLGGDPALEKKYLYNLLYDSTKTIASQQQQNNRYILRGKYESSSGAEIFLGGFSIPEGSVSVTAGGAPLIENVDYQIDYNLGRIKILNQGILASGIPINVQYEDNAAFGFLQQNFIGMRFDYFANKKLTIGATYMKLSERPFSEKTQVGDDPINNSVVGADVNYQTESQWVTRMLDKLPIYSTTAPSLIAASAEVAGIFPGHSKFIDGLADDVGGTQFIDDFEGSSSTIDLKFPVTNWGLASVPVDARDAFGTVLFPEATLTNDIRSGTNRAKLAWYNIEPTLQQSTDVPASIKADTALNDYWRQVGNTEVFPQRTNISINNALTTFDLGYYPNKRGPYNFDGVNINPGTGELLNPARRWGGIQRSIDNNSDFEALNVEYITFWVLDPYIYNQNSTGGDLYINLGNVSEDVLKDGRLSFENGIPFPKDLSKLDRTNFGYVPRFQQQITRAFDFEPDVRRAQDVGYDLLNDEEERSFFDNYVQQISATLGGSPDALAKVRSDPSNDNFVNYRDPKYDAENAGVLRRYQDVNNPQGNAPNNASNAQLSIGGNSLPESEDLNRDNTLNENESYYQYRIKIKPNMQIGESFVVNKQETTVKLKNGRQQLDTWYQMKVPIRSYDHSVGGISDFRSIRFMRLFLTGFSDSLVMRFAQMQFDRNNWRRYQFSLTNPGENIPEDDLRSTSYALTTVGVEQNSTRQPIPYVIPPGISRQEQAVSSGQNQQLDEQSLSLQVCGLKDGDSRAIFKDVGKLDMRQFEKLKMFLHAEALPNQDPIVNGDVEAFIRFGSDFTNNYYEYRVPLDITKPGTRDANLIWAKRNRLELDLKELVALKTERNNNGAQSFVPYSKIDAAGNTLVVIGNPNVGEVRNIMMGISNPKKTLDRPLDDGLRKCAEVWYDELRMTGLNEKPGYAAAANVNIQLADLGSVQASGSLHTIGYGNINQKVNERFRDNFYQYNVTSNLNLGKLLPKNWGVQLPAFAGYSENASAPQYDPYDKDVLLSEKINKSAKAGETRSRAQDFNSITSFNLNNVRFTGNPEKQRPNVMPWSLKNVDLSYSYNKQHRHNPLLELDDRTDQRLGVGYVYNLKLKPWEPFKKAFVGRSAYYNLLRDFNINPLPSNFTFRNDLRRIFGETIVRNIDDGNYELPALYYKNFTWDRTYATRWELTRSLNVNYRATNQSRIDEPFGKIDNAEARDSVWKNVLDFGRNTFYNHNITASYTVPFRKIPILDFANVTASYTTDYSWTAASLLAKSQGNTIANIQGRSVNGQLNMTQLYNKSRYLKAVNRRSGGDAGNQLKKNSRIAGTKIAGKADEANNAKDNDASEQAKNDEKTAKEQRRRNTTPVPPRPVRRLVSRDSIPGADSLAFNVVRRQLKLLKKSERIRFRKELASWRQKKQNIIPDISTGAKIAGSLATMLKNVTFNYAEDFGTILPGYTDSTKILGLNTTTFAPGLFAFGMQPTQQWLNDEAIAGRITRDSIFNQQLQQRYSQTYNVRATLEPISELRIDLTWTKNFSKNHTELFKFDNDEDRFRHLAPYDLGNYNVSYIGLHNMFKSVKNEDLPPSYLELVNSRTTISNRLGRQNPYTNGAPDPNDPDYAKGYGRYSQDVLIPAFIGAYTGKSPNEVALLNYDNSTTRSNPFKYITPLPNWAISYTGLTKVGDIGKYLVNLTINHSYNGNLSINSFASNFYYQDFLGVGFPSFIDSNSNNYIPYFQVPNITITENFGPFLGIDALFTNSLSLKLGVNKARTVSMSLIDFQISETKSSEIIVGGGYRLRGLTLPFTIFGTNKLKNDINIRADFGLRDDVTTHNYLAINNSVPTQGQKVITISPSIDYIINESLQIRFFYDRRQSIPAVSGLAFPLTTTRAGLTLRYIFAEQ